MTRIQMMKTGERGSALVVVLLVLVLLTVIGISATNISVVEQEIATNDKQHNIVLYKTDAGFAMIAKMINEAYGPNRALPAAAGLTLLDSTSVIYNQIKNFSSYDNTFDIRYVMDGTTVELDVEHWATGAGEGGGQATEFITGSRDAATGGGGGAVHYFRITADGRDQTQTRSRLSSNYIKPGDNNAGGI